MIQRNCIATATEIRYCEAMDVGLMLRSFRVVMITTVRKWSWVHAIDAVADAESRRRCS